MKAGSSRKRHESAGPDRRRQVRASEGRWRQEETDEAASSRKQENGGRWTSKGPPLQPRSGRALPPARPAQLLAVPRAWQGCARPSRAVPQPAPAPAPARPARPGPAPRRRGLTRMWIRPPPRSSRPGSPCCRAAELSVPRLGSLTLCKRN